MGAFGGEGDADIRAGQREGSIDDHQQAHEARGRDGLAASAGRGEEKARSVDEREELDGRRRHGHRDAG